MFFHDVIIILTVETDSQKYGATHIALDTTQQFRFYENCPLQVQNCLVVLEYYH